MKTVAAIILLLCFSLAHAFDNVIVFGDSLSDSASLDPRVNSIPKERLQVGKQFMDNDVSLQNTGNNYWVRTPGKVGAPVSNLNPETGLTNTWPNDFVKLFFPHREQPMIYPSSQAKFLGLSPLKDNINYAWASANSSEFYMNDDAWDREHPYPPVADQAVCQQYGPGWIGSGNTCVPGLIVQVKRYLSAVNDRPSKDSLFILWIGGNDVINNITKIYLAHKRLPGFLLLLQFYNAVYPITENGVVPLTSPIRNTVKAVQLLLDNGVNPEHIYVIGLPDLSMIPAALQFTHGSVVALGVMHSLSMLYNQILSVYLGRNLPISHLIHLDGLIASIENNPGPFGFVHVRSSCVADGAVPYCKEYVFFNRKHPTVFAHAWIASAVFSAIQAHEA